MSATRKSYPPETDKSKSSVVEDSKKKTSLLKDNSWIKKDANEDRAVDQNSNFGRTVLSRFRSSENISSSSEKSTSTVTSNSSSATVTSPSRKNVLSLSKRFSASQDELDSSGTTNTSFKSGTKTTVTTSRTSMVKSPTKSETFTEKVVTDSKTNTGKIQTVEATTKSVTKRGTVTVTTSKNDTVQEDIKTVKQASPISPTKTTKRETVTVTTFKDNPVQEDTKTVKSMTTPISPTKNTKKETVTVTTFKDTIVQEDSKTAKSAVPISPTKTSKTETVTVSTVKDIVVQEDSKTAKSAKSAAPISPTKTSKTETVTVSTVKDIVVQEDSKTAKSAAPSSPTKTRKTETITMSTVKDIVVQEDTKTAKSAPPSSPTKSITTTTYTSTSPTFKTTSYTFSSEPSAEDQLFDTLIPTPIKSAYVSDTRNDKSSGTSSTAYTRRSYKDSRPEEFISETVVTERVKTVSSTSDININSYEYGSRKGSTKTYTTVYTENRPEDFSDMYKSRSMETVYTSSERKILERDLCTICQKPMLSDTKMILEDVEIKCHASCFKCDVCQSPLGHLKAGDSMWLYRRNVHCEACFGVTKGKWLN